jgi:hypothetical protein
MGKKDKKWTKNERQMTKSTKKNSKTAKKKKKTHFDAFFLAYIYLFAILYCHFLNNNIKKHNYSKKVKYT